MLTSARALLRRWWCTWREGGHVTKTTHEPGRSAIVRCVKCGATLYVFLFGGASA